MQNAIMLKNGCLVEYPCENYVINSIIDLLMDEMESKNKLKRFVDDIAEWNFIEMNDVHFSLSVPYDFEQFKVIDLSKVAERAKDVLKEVNAIEDWKNR